MTAMKFFVPSFLFVFFVLPFPVFAQIVITEIMYDPKDTDTGSGGEWIEVRNTSPAAIDFTQWIFFEAGRNHGVTALGTPTVPPGGYAVISKDPDVFTSYFTGSLNFLFKASFSLNDGETIAMKNGKDAPVSDSVSYTAEWGAKNDGHSLQLVSGEWIAAAPTPGEENSAGEVSETFPENGSQSVPIASGYISPLEMPLFTVRISKKEKFAVIGAPMKFGAETVGTKEGLSGKTRFLWNFGDGGIAEGQSVLHTYKYPGEYVVVVDAAVPHAPSDRTVIKAVPAELSVSKIGSAADFFIELSNNSPYELNLSDWLLKSGTRYFVIPENTFLLPKKKIIFPQETTALSYSEGDVVGLLYPNGFTAHVFVGDSFPASALEGGTIQKKAAPRAVKAVTREKEKEAAPLPLPPVVMEKQSELTPRTLHAAVPLARSASSRMVWYAGVFALVLLGSAGVLFARRGKTPADEFTIKEEK